MLSLVVPALGGAIILDASSNTGPLAVGSATTPAPMMRPGDIYRIAKSGIVRIVVSYPVKNKVARSVGTGFLIDTRGDIATNCHVVSDEDATGPITVEVQFVDDPSLLPAKVLGCDQHSDIAVVRVASVSANHKPLRFAKPGTFEPGDEVIAVGYGLDLYGEPSVSHGIISALHRSIASERGDLVQTDAAINHGNSGGPLLDMRGEVVGVNSYGSVSSLKLADIIKAQSEAVENGGSTKVAVDVVSGIYYARSAVTAQAYVQRIIATGTVQRVDLGVTVDWINPNKVHLPRQGVLIKSVRPGSFGERIGLKTGDILYSIDLGDGSTWQTPDICDLDDALALALAVSGRMATIHLYNLTAKGVDAAIEQISVPASEVAWYYINLVPAAPSTIARPLS